MQIYPLLDDLTKIISIEPVLPRNFWMKFIGINKKSKNLKYHVRPFFNLELKSSIDWNRFWTLKAQ